jgi:L-alanine-DL-glutamate epimerase-like enolase superfamily enzyme
MIPFKEPFVISRGVRTHARNTIIRIFCKNGIYGTGECCLNSAVPNESHERIVSAAKKLAPILLGKNPRNIQIITALMDQLLKGNASVKSAFDMALYDLLAKLAELPLYVFLGGDDSKSIFTDMTVSILSKEKMAEKAIQFVEDGFKVLKIKLGDKSPEKDIERMKAIRSAIGAEVPLRIDANQGWNLLSALEALNGMSDYNIQHCEEPLPADNFRDQAVLRAQSPILIMADESAFNHYDTFRILAEKRADLINIKLGKSGGINHAMKMAGISQAAGVDCQVGTFSETRLGVSAAAHFAMCWDNILFYDLDSPLMLSEDPVVGGIQYSKEARINVSDKPGHGADYDPAFLKRFETISF